MVTNSRDAERRPCPLCGVLENELVWHISHNAFDNCVLPKERDLVSCSSCGFLFMNYNYTDKLLNTYYSTYFQGSSRSMEPKNGALVKRSPIIPEYVLPIIKDKVGKLPRSVCDVGCGLGGLLYQFSEFDISNLYGVELAELDEGQDRPFQHIRENIYDFNLPEKVDLITSTMVFEHLNDINKALSAMSRNLSDDGWLYIEVPDGGNTNNQSFPVMTCNIEHINVFTAYHLEEMLGRAGFVVEDIIQSCVYDESLSYLGVVARRGSQSAYQAQTPKPSIKLDMESIQYTVDPLIEPHIATQAPVYIWGLNAHTLSLLKYSRLSQANVVELMDKSPAIQANTVNGRKIVDPNIPTNASDAVVVIGAMAAEGVISRILQEMNFEGTVIKGIFGLNQ